VRPLVFLNEFIVKRFFFVKKKIEIDKNTTIEKKWEIGKGIGPIFLVIKGNSKTNYIWNIYSIPINDICGIIRKMISSAQ
jgi:hypothetical protein